MNWLSFFLGAGAMLVLQLTVVLVAAAVVDEDRIV